MGALRVQVWKEFRALAPWWAGVLFTVGVAGLIGGRQTTHTATNGLFLVATFAHVAGCALLGALSIGHEYSHRTLAALLASPADRRMLLVQKLVVLGVLISAVLATSALTFGAARFFPPYRDAQSMRVLVYGPAIAGLLLAPWLTMLSRGVLAGSVFAIAIPLFLTTTLNAFSIDFEDIWASFLVIAAFGGVMTWWTFTRLSVVDGPPAETAATLFERPMPSPPPDHERPRPAKGYLGLLLRKELRLQRLTFAVAGLYVAAWAATILARKFDPTNVYVGPSVFGMTYLYVGMVSILAGALTAAEERHYVTADWQLLLPAAAWKQWAVKSGLAIVLAVTLAIGLPLLLKTIHPSPDDLTHEWGVPLVVMMLTLSGLFTSTLNTSGVRAFLAVLPLIGASILFSTVVLVPLGDGVSALLSPTAASWFRPGTLDFRSTRSLVGWIFLAVIAGFGLLLLALAFSNYRTVDRNRGRIARQLTWLAVYSCAAAVLLSTVQTILFAGLPRFVR